MRVVLRRFVGIALDAVGVVLIVWAAWLAWHPLGFATAGGFALLLAALVDRSAPEDDTEE